MNFVSNVLSLIFGITLLGLLGAGIYYAFHYIAETLFANLDPQLAAITAIAAATFLIASFIIASAVRGVQKNTYLFNAEKKAVYEHFVQIWGNLFWQNLHQQGGIDENEVQAFEKQLMLWASPKVIQAYLALRQLEVEADFPDSKVKAQFISVLMEMRRDLGLSNLGLDAQALLKLSGSSPDKPENVWSVD
ncbi:MAG: hypothetical protein KF908_12890 [Nitrosomonas sp.]|nr:hypothetical protein [Nitrosomonas sp.]MCW5608387.1 hypothetical protein [Nitrosomonas sp.]